MALATQHHGVTLLWRALNNVAGIDIARKRINITRGAATYHRNGKLIYLCMVTAAITLSYGGMACRGMAAAFNASASAYQYGSGSAAAKRAVLPLSMTYSAAPILLQQTT